MEPAVAPQPLWIGSLPVQVSIKPIQHLHLSVVPPDGAVRISAPFGMGLEQIRTFAIGKLPWIRRQQARFAAQPRHSLRQVVERESHQLWGRRLLLHIEDLTSKLEDMKVFSTINLRKGYWQVPVAAADVPRTAIIAPLA